MTKIRINDLNYYVKTQGKGEVLLLLHGFTGDHTSWTSFAEKNSGKIFSIMPDLIGHGKTRISKQASDYDIDQITDQLLAILDRLEISKVNLLGYSMGGRIAIAFALKYPDRVKKLIIESATAGLKTEAERAERRKKDADLANFILNSSMVEFVDYWESIPLFASQKSLAAQSRQRLREQRLSNSQQGLANSLLYTGTGSQPSFWERLEEIQVETLFIVGDLDEKFCLIAKEMSELVEKSKKVIVSDCGHTIHVENFQMFDTIVSEFLLN